MIFAANMHWMFRDRVKEALLDGKSRGLTQTGLAAACGISGPSVNDWVSGKSSSMRAEHLYPAAEYLGVNPRWLATGKGPKRASADTPSPVEREILDALLLMTPAERDAWLLIAKSQRK